MAEIPNIGISVEQIRKDLDVLRSKARLGGDDFILDWLASEIAADCRKGYYEWPTAGKKGGKNK